MSGGMFFFLCILCSFSAQLLADEFSGTPFEPLNNITPEKLTGSFFFSEDPTGVVFDDNVTTHVSLEFENALKNLIKKGMKVISGGIKFGDYLDLSPKCIRGLIKYIHDLTKVKVWAVKMLDSTSKLPPGIFAGTVTDYGAFDECLEISVPLRNGSEQFRGMYCAIEAGINLPPPNKNFSTASLVHAKPDDTVSAEYRSTVKAFHYLHTRIGVCLPSSCTAQDIRRLVPKVTKNIRMKIRVPKCYVKTDTDWSAIQVAVVTVLASLLLLSVLGAFVENYVEKHPSKTLNYGICNAFIAFSLKSNYRKLLSTTKSEDELRVLHSIRFLSMIWVIIGHSYVWTNFSTTKRASNLLVWFQSLDFGPVLFGWLSVEAFFFLSGFLTCYTIVRTMEKTKGRLNVPIVVLYRYIRLTPGMLLIMGLIFLLPLLSSGPFWFEYVGTEIDACRRHWWLNLIYLGNWLSLRDICVTPTWFLSTDFQLFIISLPLLMILHRSSFLGLVTLGIVTLGSSAVVGALTYIWELPPTVMISSGNMKQIGTVMDMIHIKTYTHAGPYFIGMATGYVMLKKKDVQLSKLQNTAGWCASTFLSLSTVYGLHWWNTGYLHGLLFSSLFAAFHRTALTLGIAWVVFACVNGKGGPVNWMLTSKAWVPLSRLTYMVYLLHGPVMWMRKGTARERMYLSHYNMFYEYTATLVIVVIISVPLYLILEAPMGRLLGMFVKKILHSKEKDENENSRPKQDSNIDTVNVNNGFVSSNIELTSVKVVNLEEQRTSEVFSGGQNRYSN